jgi:putative hydrolase of the HAD superfamily
MVKPANTMVDAVIFDLGGVLIEVDFAKTNAAISRAVRLAPAEIARRLITDPALIEFECGRLTTEAFHRKVETILECSMTLDVFHGAWNGIFNAEIEENIELLRKLRRKCEVGILSNTNLPHFEQLKQRMKVLNELDHLYASHEIGCRKPDAESYRHVLNKMKVAPERAVFIDDLPVNLEGARKVGMRTIHASGPGAVKAGLKEMGLI